MSAAKPSRLEAAMLAVGCRMCGARRTHWCRMTRGPRCGEKRAALHMSRLRSARTSAQISREISSLQLLAELASDLEQMGRVRYCRARIKKLRALLANGGAA